MGIKSKIKLWLSVKLKNLTDYEKFPILIVNSNSINVGRNSYHNGNFEVRGAGKITIGSFCAFGKDIKIITKNHNYNYASMQYSFYKKYFSEMPFKSEYNIEFSISIGNDVWIGDNVSILPNVKIGNGAIIGTGSVVTKNVDDYSIVAGVPAKFIKDRFNNEIKEQLLKSEWWNWTDEKIQQNKTFFCQNYNLQEEL